MEELYLFFIILVLGKFIYQIILLLKLYIYEDENINELLNKKDMLIIKDIFNGKELFQDNLFCDLIRTFLYVLTIVLFLLLAMVAR